MEAICGNWIKKEELLRGMLVGEGWIYEEDQETGDVVLGYKGNVAGRGGRSIEG